jgi:hypothetical protein
MHNYHGGYPTISHMNTYLGTSVILFVHGIISKLYLIMALVQRSTSESANGVIMALVQHSTGESENGAEHENTHAAGEEMFGGFFDANGNDANDFAVGNFSHPVMIYLHFEISMLEEKEVWHTFLC